MKVTEKTITCAVEEADRLVISDAPALKDGICIEIQTRAGFALVVLRMDGLNKLMTELKTTKAELAASLVMNKPASDV